MKNASSAKGAKTKREEITRRAEARRKGRKVRGEPLAPSRSAEQIEAAAVTLLRKHKVLVNPATTRIAKIHEQMNDAVDALYDTAVRQGKEQRQISSMVSAGKLAVSTLNMLGLPGDELEDDEAAAAEQAAEEAERAKASKSLSSKKPAADEPDELEAFE